MCVNRPPIMGVAITYLSLTNRDVKKWLILGGCGRMKIRSEKSDLRASAYVQLVV